MAHQQECFLPFSSRRSLSCCQSCVVKRSTLRPCGPDSGLSLRILSLHGCHTWVWISAPVFLCSPISDSSYNQLHLPAFPILPALLGCHSKSRQVWSHGVEPIISTLSRRRCFQGELLPSYILGGSHSQPLGSKQGHSYLTYLWNQLKTIGMLNDHARG